MGLANSFASHTTPLPVLTRHARARCEEMRVPQRVAQWIVQNADLVRPAPHDRSMAVSDVCPDYAVVFAEQADHRPPVIITVLFRTYENYERAGDGYFPVQRPTGKVA